MRLLEVVREDLRVLILPLAVAVDALGPVREALVEHRAGSLQERAVRRLTDEASRPSARDSPRGMGAIPVRGLREPQFEPLGQEDERVEEASGQRHVVVDHQQPVVSLGRLPLEQRVEVFELPPAAGHCPFEMDLVAGAAQLRSSGRQECGLALALNRQRQYSPARRSRGGRSQPRALEKR